MKDLKDYRSKELLSYVIANILLFLLCTNMFDMIFDADYVDSFNLISTLFGAAVYGSILFIYVYLIDSLLPGDRKDYIAWFGKYNLPGCRIFVDLKNKERDIRFKKDDAIKKYKNIYDNMPVEKKKIAKYQNAAWYGIYKRYRDAGSVYTANRDYLLCRDLYISTLSMAVLYILIVLFFYIVKGNDIFSIEFCVILLIEGVLTNLAMHGKGWRFCYNVIAEDINTKDDVD